MGVRIATLDDLDLAVDLSMKFLLTTLHKDYGDYDTVVDFCTDFLSNPNITKKVCFMFDDIGMLAGVANKFLFGTKLIAYDLAWWVEPSVRGKKAGIELFNAFEYWAKSIGCSIINMVAIEEQTGKFYEKNGYIPHERAYVKEI